MYIYIYIKNNYIYISTYAYMYRFGFLRRTEIVLQCPNRFHTYSGTVATMTILSI